MEKFAIMIASIIITNDYPEKKEQGPLALDLNLLPLCQAQTAMEDTLNLGVAMKRSPEALGQ